VTIHFAAETHVDRSIEDAFPFLKTNTRHTPSS
jgi:dTDP-D-glucose 4,6-dehydratase